MDIYYKNGDGEILDFQKWPYLIRNHDLLDYGWSYTTSAGKVKRFSKAVLERSLALNISADTKQDYYDALNHFSETVEKDVLQNRPGRFYIGNQYLSCNVIASTKTEWQKGVNYLKNTMVILPRQAFWITEVLFLFRHAPSASGPWLDYPYSYMYDYLQANESQRSILNNIHYCDCQFLATIYGPCVSPSFVVDDHPYTVITTVEEGEYLQINSREKTVVRVANTGDRINEYNNRRKGISVFDPITPGLHDVTWNGAFDFDLIIYEERSEPKWS